jgi:hypothetical protein
METGEPMEEQMSLASAVKGMAGKIAGFFKSGKAQAAFDAVAALVPKALPIVEIIAEMTPTLADDNLIALFRKHGLPQLESYLALPVELRGVALSRAGRILLGRQAPAGTPNPILDTAVQNAYLAYTTQKST